MTTRLWLKIQLQSDTTFGRGDGSAGVVDDEVQHDRYGLPFISGKTLKGLLGAECAEVMFALAQTWQSDAHKLEHWRDAAQFLFGEAGSGHSEASQMRVGDARLPQDLRAKLVEEFRAAENAPNEKERARQWGILRAANLNALTALRRQTAMDAATGAPLDDTLRSMRVILRDTVFFAALDFTTTLENVPAQVKPLLAASVASFRRAGTGRNRGRGKLTAELYDQDPVAPDASTGLEPVSKLWMQTFAEEVRGASAHI